MPLSRVAMRSGLIVAALLGMAPARGWTADASTTIGPRSGVIVEEVAERSEGRRAGLRADDEIAGWKRSAPPDATAAEGAVESPFDLMTVEIEQAPRGPVTLVGRREGQDREWTLGEDDWGLVTRPQLPAALLALYKEGRARAAAAAAETDGLASIAAWLLSADGRAAAAAQRWDEADAGYRECTAILRRDGLAARELSALRGWCAETESRGAAPTRECVERGLSRATDAAPGTLVLAMWLFEAADIARRSGDNGLAVARFERALEMRERYARGSVVHIRTLNGLGGVAYGADLEAAGRYFRKALALAEAHAPESVHTANSLNNVAEVARERGDLAEAYEYHQRALALRRRLGASTAASLTNLSLLAMRRGDLARAEQYATEALRLWQERTPETAYVGKALHSLGLIAVERGDLAAADDFFRRALAVYEKHAPGAIEVAHELNSLGVVAFERADAATATEYWTRALKIKEALAPRSLSTAVSLQSLGRAALARGRYDEAEASYRRALAIQEEQAPDSLVVAETRGGLADVARARGDLPTAEAELRAALAIQERLAPGSSGVAQSLHALGEVQSAAGRREAGARTLCDAVDVLEQQTARLGGGDQLRTGFGARYAGYYHGCLQARLDLDRPADAYHVLERSRARSLLHMLAERDVFFAGDLPPDMARARTLVDAEYDRVQARLARLQPARDAAEIETSLGRLRELRTKQEDLAAAIRAAAPRLASLQYPQPLDLPHVRQALDRGTVLLSYSVGAERTALFVVTPADDPAAPVSVFPIPIGASELRRRVEAFRDALQPPQRVTRADLDAQGAALYDLLIRPAEALIAPCARLLLSPDGPLHSLPFAALVRTPGPDAGRRAASYLVEWKPLHVAPSATVYAELRKPRGDAAPAPGRLVAFGTPLYPPLGDTRGSAAQDPDLRSLATRGVFLTSLPATGDEVDHIARLFGRDARTYVGAEATEERAKSLGRDARYIHFACHGTLDERFPLNSALALTIPQKTVDGQDNGLLQAWEIFDRVRIDADLVTLSACNTALGKDMGGEGLLGLTRAFHYAGARSVLATLWSVSDRSTSQLMTQFYRHLKAGRSRDEALRLAQVDLIRSRRARPGDADLSHPFRWAAFQLSGDWR